MNPTTRLTAAEVEPRTLPIDLSEPPPYADEGIDPDWWVQQDNDPEAWPDEIVTLANDAEVDGVCLDLPTWLGDQSSYYRSLGSAAGRWLAAELTELGRQARELDARTVDIFVSRREQAECSRAEDLAHFGYCRGLRDAQASGDGMPYGFGTPA